MTKRTAETHGAFHARRRHLRAASSSVRPPCPQPYEKPPRQTSASSRPLRRSPQPGRSMADQEMSRSQVLGPRRDAQRIRFVAVTIVSRVVCSGNGWLLPEPIERRGGAKPGGWSQASITCELRRSPIQDQGPQFRRLTPVKWCCAIAE